MSAWQCTRFFVIVQLTSTSFGDCIRALRISSISPLLGCQRETRASGLLGAPTTCHLLPIFVCSIGLHDQGFLPLISSGHNVTQDLANGPCSEVAHKWARWLHGPCRLGGPHRFKAGGRLRGGPQVGKVATWPLPPGGSPPLQSGGQNQRGPTSGQGGYMAPAAWGVPTASKRGAESQVAHKWARWLPSKLVKKNFFSLGSDT